MFIRNAWYVAAWDHEVERSLLGRKILNEPVVIYRKRDGGVVALEDRCCHRHYPLSKGELIDDKIQCGYHGMIYDASGACVDIPWQKNVPRSAKVKSYPAVEQFHWIWIWMGDPELADESKITDFHWLDDPQWGAKGTYFHIQSDYRLIIENLLDLSHLAYVHRSTLGNVAVAEAAKTKYERGSNNVRVTRWMIDTEPPPTYIKAGSFEGNVDRWQIIDFTPPAHVRLDVGACDTGTGAPKGRRNGGIEMRNLNAITPETDQTTHYFWAQAHNFDVDNQAMTEMLFEQVRTAFLEDKDIFEAQQQTTNLNPTVRRINLSGDAGGLAALEIIDRLCREESANSG